MCTVPLDNDSHNLNQRLNFKIETHSTASLVPLIDTCRSGGAICPGGGSDEQKNIKKKHSKSNNPLHSFLEGFWFGQCLLYRAGRGVLNKQF